MEQTIAIQREGYHDLIAAKDSAIAAKDETIRVMASFMSRV
jgi:hypothetical protein